MAHHVAFLHRCRIRAKLLQSLGLEAENGVQGKKVLRI